MLKIDRSAFLALALGMNLGACYTTASGGAGATTGGTQRPPMTGPVSEAGMAPHNECVGWTPSGECNKWEAAAAPHHECTGWTPAGECNQWDTPVAPQNECVAWTPTGECSKWEPRRE